MPEALRRTAFSSRTERPDSDDQYFEGIDLLDATKLVPEELVPVQPIGRMTLNRNPSNFFAEVEQVAFHTGHLVRGVEVVDDPLMQSRLFSYLDTQLTRLGGPNFSQIPINRPLAPVNDNFRDGLHQSAVHQGRTPYLPNGIGGGCPFLADASNGGYIPVPRMVEGQKVRGRGPNDEYAQAKMFWRSMTEVEQDHIVDAYTFELGKVEVPDVVERMIARLAFIDRTLAMRIAFGLGVTVPETPIDPAEASPGADPEVTNVDQASSSAPIESSPALAMVTDDRYPIDGRVVHILANDGCDLAGIRTLQTALLAEDAVPHVIATHKGMISSGARGKDQLVVDRSFHTSCSAEADAVVVASGTGLAENPGVLTYVQSAYRHYKPIGAWGDGDQLLLNAGIDTTAPGVAVTAKANRAFAASIIDALAVHRHWARGPEHLTRHLGDRQTGV